MIPARSIVVLACLWALVARGDGAERNIWPVYVAQEDAAGDIQSWQSVGPLIFREPSPDRDNVGSAVSGFRPLFVRTQDVGGMTTVASVLYPVFIYRADSDTYKWTILNLITGAGPKHEMPPTAASGDQTKAFDLWIFYFSRQTGSPETSYRALFPIAGTIKYRFGKDELRWVLWPLFFQVKKDGATTTSTPWPFVQVVTGTEHGFALWPLYGQRDKPDQFHKSFFLWPLGWNNTIQPPEDAPAGTPPTRQFGFIPFYTRETRDRYINEDYVWPFFGYTDRSLPNRYHETRYLWPFFVQGRGEDRYVNRWGPFYTHSIAKGMDKTWVMWPLLKELKWEDPGVAQKRTQFLYLLYWSQQQRSLTNPRAAPADRTHIWPLFSKWDNGAGRRQFQLFSPFDVFFPDNDNVRESWTPLFSVFRYDQRAPDDQRWSLLWRAVTWRRDPGGKEFHLGPLFSIESHANLGRVAIGNGILGWKRDPGDKGWHVFWFDFQSKVSKLPPPSR